MALQTLRSPFHHVPLSLEGASRELVNQLTEKNPKHLPTAVVQILPLWTVSSYQHDVAEFGIGERCTKSVLGGTRRQWTAGHISQPTRISHTGVAL